MSGVFSRVLEKLLMKAVIKEIISKSPKEKEWDRIKEEIRKVKTNVRKVTYHLKETFGEEYSSLGIPSILYYQKNDQLQPLYKAKLDPSTREKWEIAQLSLFASSPTLCGIVVTSMGEVYDKVYKMCRSRGWEILDKPSYLLHLRNSLDYLTSYLRNPSDILNSYNLYLRDAEKMEEKERTERFLKEFGGPILFMSPLKFIKYIAIREGIDPDDDSKFFPFLKKKFRYDLPSIQFLHDYYQSFRIPLLAFFISAVETINSNKKLKELFLYL